ncbi:MAG: 5'/3'-nucleotidase SurE [Chitinophagaceae bacterium]|nr:5'/3'-nucleotidase SurE [Chitinophagaceae bacterium]
MATKKKSVVDKTRPAPRPPSARNKSTKPVILVTNDDGYMAPGIQNLVEAVKDLGKVVVVAPDKPQSGMGHAITIGQPLRLHKVNTFGDIEAYACTGTPVDCVKLAVDKVLHRKPDICVSGVNHGANHSINVIYSGTMSAAVEAAIESIPSAGFSLLDFSIEADFSGARKYARMVVEKMLSTKNGTAYSTECKHSCHASQPAERFKDLPAGLCQIRRRFYRTSGSAWTDVLLAYR